MPRPQQVSFSLETRLDLRKAYNWYEAQLPGLGRRFTSMFVQAVDLAIERPTSLPIVVADVRRAILAKFPFGIFFRIVDDVIRVIGIIDLRSDDQVWMKRITP